MGRARLKSLKESTLLTFLSICRDWGLVKDKHYKLNIIDGVIRFWNDSEVYLKDLFLYPTDPEFDSLGSTEFTGAFIDECSQITLKAKNIVMSRIRYRLEENKKVPKLFMASNPSKNFLYYDFYKPWKEGELPHYRKFVRALVQDNPFISPHYIENLKKLDKVSKERLLFGNFEYDDDPAKMIEYDAIIDIFKSEWKKDGKKYLSVDVARYGSDKSVFIVWDGLHIVKIYSYDITSTNFVEDKIKEFEKKYGIRRSQVVVDDGGVGGGVVDHTPGCVGFVSNARQIDHTKNYQDKRLNFANLKAQCSYCMAEAVNDRKLSCYSEIPTEIKELIIEDLEQVKRKDPDKDTKFAIIPKDMIKELIGRSPDIGDALMMRFYFNVNKKQVGYFFG